MVNQVRIYRLAVVMLTAALVITLAVAVTGGEPADAVEGPVDLVYVATGQNFPDALAGANLAATVGAPMLTVNPDLPLPPATIASLEALDPDRIILFGGPVAVSEAVRGRLADFARSGSVTRIAGGDRHETAAQIADALPNRVHDTELLDGLDSSDFSRAGHDHDGTYLGATDTAEDSDALGGMPDQDYRAWPLQFQRALAGATLDALGGPRLPNTGSPHLTAYYSLPPTVEPGTDNRLTVAIHDFMPTGCTVRLRVWGTGSSGTSQYHHVDIVDEGSDGYAALDVPWFGFAGRAGGYVHVVRDADHAADTCTSGINIIGMHFTFGVS